MRRAEYVILGHFMWWTDETPRIFILKENCCKVLQRIGIEWTFQSSWQTLLVMLCILRRQEKCETTKEWKQILSIGLYFTKSLVLKCEEPEISKRFDHDIFYVLFTYSSFVYFKSSRSAIDLVLNSFFF